MTFTFEGYSADDTDQMVFAFNGDALFTNKIAAVGDVIHQVVVAGQIYRLGLRNDNTGDNWSSDPASNWGGLASLPRQHQHFFRFRPWRGGADAREHALCACQRLLFRLGKLGARGR